MLTIAMLIGVRGVVNYIQSGVGTQYIPESMKFLGKSILNIRRLF
jgi:hypothetical protein